MLVRIDNDPKLNIRQDKAIISERGGTTIEELEMDSNQLKRQINNASLISAEAYWHDQNRGRGHISTPERFLTAHL